MVNKSTERAILDSLQRRGLRQVNSHCRYVTGLRAWLRWKLCRGVRKTVERSDGVTDYYVGGRHVWSRRS